MNQKKQKTLTYRCKNDRKHPVTIVIDWFHSLNPQHRREQMERMLLGYLPYAYAHDDEKTKEEIENCYWDVYQRLQDHLFVMRQILDIKVNVSSSSDLGINISTNSLEKPRAKEKETLVEEVNFSDFDSVF